MRRDQAAGSGVDQMRFVTEEYGIGPQQRERFGILNELLW